MEFQNPVRQYDHRYTPAALTDDIKVGRKRPQVGGEKLMNCYIDSDMFVVVRL
jgi:hypothetical protein